MLSRLLSVYMDMTFLGRKFLSILRASIIVEMVSFIVTMTDTLVAGNMIGTKGLAAIGAVTPVVGISTFLMSVVNSGTVPKYSYHIGRFDKKRANEYFSQGILLGLALGVLCLILLLSFKSTIITALNIHDDMLLYAQDYYSIIVFCFLMDPIMALLDNMTVANGGERLSEAANVIQIIANVVLSILFSRIWGVRGIAIASLLCKAMFLAIIIIWFLRGKSPVRFFPHWSMKECIEIIESGSVRASYYAMTALMNAALNAFVLYFFAEDVFVLATAAERFLDVSAVFTGMSLSMQPMIATLRGEKNTKAIRGLMQMVNRTMIDAGILMTVLSLITAPLIIRAFGINNEQLIAAGSTAIRIISSTLLFRSIMAVFFNFYFLIGKKWLPFMITALKDFICPVGLAIGGAFFLGAAGLWAGLALSQVIAAGIIALNVRRRFGKDMFPYLLPTEGEYRIHIFNTEISESSAVELSQKAAAIVGENGYSTRIKNLVSLYIEELLLLIISRNEHSGKKKLYAELTIMLENEGVRMILRDSGIIFDLTDEDVKLGDFRQYVVANIMNSLSFKANILTTGYNRNEFFFD